MFDKPCFYIIIEQNTDPHSAKLKLQNIEIMLMN